MTSTAPKIFPRALHGYIGNGHLFQFLKPYEEKSKVIKFFNSVYNLAPSSKWGLSIVPLYGVFIGNPPVEKIDLATSASLTCTGVVWSFYATLIKPANFGAFLLGSVNCCMAAVNGYNCYRKVSVDGWKF